MREILFRAKRIDNGEWVEGQYAYILNSKTENGEPIKHFICNGTNVFSYEVDPETLCQYTGLNSRNGKKIWENDIIRVENSADEGTGVVVFYEGVWYVIGGVNNSLYNIVLYDDEAEIYIIGNIIDNSYMVKKG